MHQVLEKEAATIKSDHSGKLSISSSEIDSSSSQKVGKDIDDLNTQSSS